MSAHTVNNRVKFLTETWGPDHRTYLEIQVGDRTFQIVADDKTLEVATSSAILINPIATSSMILEVASDDPNQSIALQQFRALENIKVK